MKKFFLFLYFILFLSKAFALDLSDWQKSVVKVSSYPCLTEWPRLEGSGLVFKKDNQILVLTSEHVLINDTSHKICHQVENDFLGQQNAKLILANYEKGMALLQLSAGEDFSHSILNWDDLKKSENVSEDLIAMGYPAQSKNLQILSQGKLQSAQSQRALIPKVNHFLEATHLPVEYGMSGGLLLNAYNSSIAGLISHQYLKRQPSKPTEVGNVSEESLALTDIAISIPTSEIILFVESANHTDDMFLSRSASAQLKNEVVISYGVLNFKLTQKYANDLWQVGGADGSGVGGADGSGVGGSGQEVSIEQFNIIEVSLNPDATSVERSQIYPISAFEEWKNILLRGQVLYITQLKNQKQNKLQKILTLDQFFTLWFRDQYQPIILKSVKDQTEAKIKIIMAKTRKLIQLAQINKDQTGSLELKSWLTKIRDEALLFENNSVDISHIENLLSGVNDSFWYSFYQADFEAAVTLEAAIRDILAIK